MPILGINYEKCDNCQNCYNACTRYFRRDREQNKIVFKDPNNLCDSCGRCVARCKLDAILYEDLGDFLSFEEVQDPSSLILYETMQKFMSAKRSIRGFKRKKVPSKILQKVLDSMKYAPTGSNIRTLRCTIISDEDKIKKLSEVITQKIIEGFYPPYSQNLKKLQEHGIDAIFYNAPHVMIIHSNNSLDSINSTIALTYGMLSAQTLGLGSCWIGLANRVLELNKEVRENIAGVYGTVWGVIIIGYPTQIYYRVPPRPDIETKGLEDAKIQIRPKLFMRGPQYIEKEEFEVIGIEDIGKEGKRSIAQIWEKFERIRNKIPNILSFNPVFEIYMTPNWTSKKGGDRRIVGCTTKPVLFNTDDDLYGRNIYLKTEVEDIPEGAVLVTIPAQKYAVFTHIGNADNFMETIQYLYGEWLPNNKKYKRVPLAPEFAWYDRGRFKPNSDNSEFDWYIPIQEKTSPTKK
ncbi:MAG: nitroreductase family protein [Promethearchaeota archaeon]|jgi:predicted transcriptional regulator YdeE/nitroreductase/NAD-dependent dihydropyrimidine dehydrogenase PreA subunit